MEDKSSGIMKIKDCYIRQMIPSDDCFRQNKEAAERGRRRKCSDNLTDHLIGNSALKLEK